MLRTFKMLFEKYKISILFFQLPSISNVFKVIRCDLSSMNMFPIFPSISFLNQSNNRNANDRQPE
jgi:hypothetical protein